MRRCLLFAAAACAACATGGAPVDSSLGGASPPPGVITSSTGADVRLGVDTDPSQHRVKGSLTAVWAALADVYEGLSIPLDYADPRGYRAGNSRWTTRGNIGTSRMSTFLRCGIGPAGPLADSHRVTMSVITELKSVSADTTAVLTQVTATASPVDGSSTAAVNCATTVRSRPRSWPVCGRTCPDNRPVECREKRKPARSAGFFRGCHFGICSGNFGHDRLSAWV